MKAIPEMSDAVNNSSIQRTIRGLIESVSPKAVEKSNRRRRNSVKKAKPHNAITAWVRRRQTALDRVLFAAAAAAKVIADREQEEVYETERYGSTECRRGSRAREDEAYFEILEAIGRAGELAAARAAGYRTWDAFQTDLKPQILFMQIDP
jgi:hypothetical protein